MFVTSSTSDSVTALARVASRIGVTLDPMDVRRARERVVQSAANWRDRLREAGHELGLRVTFFDGDPAVAAELADRHGPVIGWSDSEHEFLTVVGPGRRGIRLLGSDGDETVERVSLVARALGADRQAVTWAVAEPEAPLPGAVEEHPSPQRRVVSLLADEHRDLKVVLAYAVAIGLLSLAVPIAVQALVNSVAFGTVLQPVLVLTILVLIALGFAGALRVLQSTVVEWIQQRTFVRVAADMAHRLALVRRDALGAAYVPELANRFFDVVTVQKSAATLLLDGIGLILQTVVGLVILAFYHPLLLAFDVVLLAAIAFVVFVLGRGAIETAIKESKAKYAMASWLEDIARHPTSFRSASGRAFALDRVDLLATTYITYRRKHWKILVRQIAGTKALQAVASAALLGVGGLLVIRRQLTLGQLVAAELIVTSVLAGVAKFGKHLESYYDLVAAVDKLGHVIDLPAEPTGDEVFPRRDRGVDVLLDSVSVGGDERTLDLHLAPGARVAVRGANGSGKSTLVDIIYGVHTPTRGFVRVDGIDLRSVDRGSYRGAVAVVRGNEAFDGTIADNIRIGRAAVDDAAVRDALAAVGLLDEVLALPNGTATEIATDGAPLSAGQTRRLMLARAIAGRPRLLMLDEALDGVDDEARARIASVLFSPDARWTLLITTHVPEIAAMCDVRYRFDGGMLTAEES